MRRRKLLQGIASVGIGSGFLGTAAAQPKSREVPQKEFASWEEKYGTDEAEIIAQGVSDGKGVVEILYHPDLTNAREDYLRYEYSKDPAHKNIDNRLLQVASSREIARAQSVSPTSTNWNFDTPCTNFTNVSTNSSADLTFDSFLFQDANKSTYNGGSASYRSGCNNDNADKLNASATAAIYGSAHVHLRHVAAVTGGLYDYSGTYTVVGKFDVKGNAVGGSANLSILKYDSSTGALQRHQIKEITTSIDTTVSGQTTFDFSDGDHVGVELIADASSGGGAAFADIKDQGKGANPTIELYS